MNIFLAGEVETWVGDNFILRTALQVPGEDDVFVDTMIPIRANPVSISRIRKTRLGVNGKIKNEDYGFGSRLVVEAEDIYLAGAKVPDMNIVVLRDATTVRIPKEQIVPFDDPRFIKEEIPWEHIVMDGSDAYPCKIAESIHKPSKIICCLVSEPYPHLLALAASSSPIDVGPLGSRPLPVNERNFQDDGSSENQQSGGPSKPQRKVILRATKSNFTALQGDRPKLGFSSSRKSRSLGGK
jgi:hypothetical protein